MVGVGSRVGGGPMLVLGSLIVFLHCTVTGPDNCAASAAAEEDEESLDVHLSLDVRCTSDDTMAVTSKDLRLDPKFPGGSGGRVGVGGGGLVGGWGWVARAAVCTAGRRGQRLTPCRTRSRCLPLPASAR